MYQVITRLESHDLYMKLCPSRGLEISTLLMDNYPGRGHTHTMGIRGWARIRRSFDESSTLVDCATGEELATGLNRS